MFKDNDECKCWNPEVMEDIAEDGSYIDYCDNCGQLYLRDIEPYKEVIQLLEEVNEACVDLSLRAKINDAIKIIKATDY